MDLNYWAVLVCGILSMVVGFIWYGPLFKKQWMEIIGVDLNNLEAQKNMQKNAAILSLIQILLALFQVWVLAQMIGGSSDALQKSIWIWAGFVMPTVAGGVMWNNHSRRIAWMRFFIQAGYQLIIFIIFGVVLGMWK